MGEKPSELELLGLELIMLEVVVIGGGVGVVNINF